MLSRTQPVPSELAERVLQRRVIGRAEQSARRVCGTKADALGAAVTAGCARSLADGSSGCNGSSGQSVPRSARLSSQRVVDALGSSLVMTMMWWLSLGYRDCHAAWGDRNAALSGDLDRRKKPRLRCAVGAVSWWRSSGFRRRSAGRPKRIRKRWRMDWLNSSTIRWQAIAGVVAAVQCLRAIGEHGDGRDLATLLGRLDRDVPID